MRTNGIGVDVMKTYLFFWATDWSPMLTFNKNMVPHGKRTHLLDNIRTWYE